MLLFNQNFMIIYIDKCITKAAAVMAKMSKTVWDISQLTLHTKLKVFQACVLSTLLYGSETCTTYIRQKTLEKFPSTLPTNASCCDGQADT